MRITQNRCRGLILLLLLCLSPIPVSASGFSDKFAEKITKDNHAQEQIKNVFDTVEAEVESWASKGETTRGASGPIMQLLYGSDTLICSSWIIAFRQELQRLIVSDYLDPPLGLIRGMQDLLSRVERACQGVLQPGMPASVTTPGAGAVATPETAPAPTPPAGQPFTPRPGWSINDEICARKCSAESAAVQRADWRKYDAESAEKNARERLAAAERKLASERENLARAEARLEAARTNLDRREAFSKQLPSLTKADQDAMTEARANAAAAERELSIVRNRVASKQADATSARGALDRAAADRARAEQEVANARAALGRCLRDCYRQAQGDGQKSERLGDKSADKTKQVQEKDGRTVRKDGDPPKKEGPDGKQVPDKQPSAGADLRLPPMKDKGGGGMQRIDPPPPQESILDSIDDGNFRRAPAPAAAACPDCTTLANRLAQQQAELKRESAELDRRRRNYTEVTAGRGMDRRVPEGQDATRSTIDLVAQTEASIRRQAQKVEDIERGIEMLNRQLEACNKGCEKQPDGRGGTGLVPGTTSGHATRCSACNHMGGRLGEIERERKAKEAERERLSREAQEISGRAIEGKAQAGDGSRLQERRRAIERLSNEIDALNRETERLDGEMRECERSACPPPKPDGRKEAAFQKDSSIIPAGGQGCSFPAVKPATIGPREKFGYGDEQKAGEVGKAALSILGGFLGGGRGGGGGGGGGPFQGGPSGGDKPRLADDPIRDKQTFTDSATGTAIKVGGQYRPDGRLLVSVDVDKAEDKGVVHHATLERLVPQPDGSCKTQVAEPTEWLHYEIWEDWWAKIRIQRYESVDGGPWRKTHDTGWRDWGSGSRLLESGTLSADQIPRTAWGSMGADRAFGGPRSAGALFDPGKPLVTGQPAPERLVVHVTRPGQDPVTTVPFTLYPTYANDGKVSYGNTAPEFDKWLKESGKPKPGEIDKMLKDPPPSLGGRGNYNPAPSPPRPGERLE
ncbi:MAG: hypothetical protein AMXMBFR31_07330 [Candidatus Desulfobacillus denitrificans]